MVFEFISGNLALDFANTVHNFGGRDPGDDLKTNSDLIDWGVQAGVIKEHERKRLLRKVEGDKTVLRRTRQLRNMVFFLFVRGLAIVTLGLSSYRPDLPSSCRY